MAVYQVGSHGPEVVQIQRKLQDAHLYTGPLDGDFGGGTQSAVKAFQKAQGITVDGIVGPETWDRLFPEQPIPVPAIAGRPVAERCLALTGAFETNSGIPDCFAGLSGDFDGQGLSFGVLQWNLGQGSLQPLLKEMNEAHADVLKQVLQDHYPVLIAMLESDAQEQLRWARSIQDTVKCAVLEPWRGLFRALGRTDEFQDIEVEHSQRLYEEALALCDEYGLQSERATALMFDIKVQNGSISPLVKAQILQDFSSQGLGAGDEVARMQIIANRRAEAANPRWIEDVRSRKLTIANGRGTVHGNDYDLEEQFGIRLQPVARMAGTSAARS